jgi:hypothetical protein
MWLALASFPSLASFSTRSLLPGITPQTNCLQPNSYPNVDFWGIELQLYIFYSTKMV